ncbi:hypothetical protein ACLOJK_037257, partial [Asimina triloba]
CAASRRSDCWRRMNGTLSTVVGDEVGGGASVVMAVMAGGEEDSCGLSGFGISASVPLA